MLVIFAIDHRLDIDVLRLSLLVGDATRVIRPVIDNVDLVFDNHLDRLAFTRLMLAALVVRVATADVLNLLEARRVTDARVV